MKRLNRGMAITSMLMVTSMLLAACGANSTATPVAAPTATKAAAAAPTATTAASAPTATTAAAGPTATTAAAKPTIPPTIPVAPFSGDTIKIAVDLPTSGADASDGVPTRNGVELAIEQANAKGGVTIGGKTYKLAMYALDDAVNGVAQPGSGCEERPAVHRRPRRHGDGRPVQLQRGPRRNADPEQVPAWPISAPLTPTRH